MAGIASRATRMGRSQVSRGEKDLMAFQMPSAGDKVEVVTRNYIAELSGFFSGHTQGREGRCGSVEVKATGLTRE